MSKIQIELLLLHWWCPLFHRRFLMTQIWRENSCNATSRLVRSQSVIQGPSQDRRTQSIIHVCVDRGWLTLHHEKSLTLLGCPITSQLPKFLWFQWTAVFTRRQREDCVIPLCFAIRMWCNLFSIVCNTWISLDSDWSVMLVTIHQPYSSLTYVDFAVRGLQRWEDWLYWWKKRKEKDWIADFALKFGSWYTHEFPQQ